MTSTSERVPFLIAGGGLAAARAAEALRAEGAVGRIVALAAETERPYNRPSLSKDLLRGETPRADVFVHPADWAGAHDIELRLGATAARGGLCVRVETPCVTASGCSALIVSPLRASS